MRRRGGEVMRQRARRNSCNCAGGGAARKPAIIRLPPQPSTPLRRLPPQPSTPLRRLPPQPSTPLRRLLPPPLLLTSASASSPRPASPPAALRGAAGNRSHRCQTAQRPRRPDARPRPLGEREKERGAGKRRATGDMGEWVWGGSKRLRRQGGRPCRRKGGGEEVHMEGEGEGAGGEGTSAVGF